tara:strand:- start:115 stop:834 length:720 start_codon:yes stop_codon:yes gene_type:complete
MKNLEKYLTAKGDNKFQYHAQLVDDLQNMQNIYGDRFSMPWNTKYHRCEHLGEPNLTYYLKENIKDLFERLHEEIRRVRSQIRLENDSLNLPFKERIREDLQNYIDKVAPNIMSKDINVEKLGSKSSRITVTARFGHRFDLTVPYSIVPKIKKGIVLIDNKIVLKSWDKVDATDECISEACQYYAMDRHKHWETRNGFIAHMEVEDGPTIAAIRETRDKACGAVRGKIRKETLKRMGLA